MSKKSEEETGERNLFLLNIMYRSLLNTFIVIYGTKRIVYENNLRSIEL